MPESFSPPPEELFKPPKHLAVPEQATASDREPEPTVGEAITRYEKELGLNTEMDRLAEASLFIDQKFLKADIITGNNQHPERFFGDEAWADWLAARLRAKSYGRRPLTPEFIAQLHYIVAKRSAPMDAGFLRRGSVVGGDYTNLGSRMTVTPEQLAAIKSNPRLQFIDHVTDQNGGIKGRIEYPRARWGGPRNREMLLSELQQLSDWYNQERIKPDFDPYKAAAGLQHRLISIHAFGDNNGRLSRLLMDWSLENDHLEPSVLYDPSDDLFNSEEDWANQVQFGSQFTGKLIKERQAALESIGQEDIAFMLGVDTQKTFFNAIYRQLDGAVVPSQSDAHTHQTYEQFWRHFSDQYWAFKAEATWSGILQGTRNSYTGGELAPPELMVQGGLIPESYINLVKSGKLLPDSIRAAYFGSSELYRGGISSRMLTDRDLCQMFTSFLVLALGIRLSRIRIHLQCHPVQLALPISPRPWPLTTKR